MRPTALQHVADSVADSLGYADCVYVAHGAFKETFCVENAAGEKLALKIVDGAKIDRVRTVREIEAISKCNSPNIAKIVGVRSYTDSSGISYDIIFEEYLDGGTLDDRLISNTLKSSEFKALATGLIVALKELQSHALVHRDIKPANIMFRKNGVEPVLVDFSVVRDLNQAALTASWAMQGPGTPQFAAPEQLHNQRHLIDWRTDQFSIGVVLAYAHLGIHPYEEPGMPVHDVIDAVSARRPSKHFASLASKDIIAGYIATMVKPWPVQRYSTPEKLFELVQNL